jgi:hypothetical protein
MLRSIRPKRATSSRLHGSPGRISSGPTLAWVATKLMLSQASLAKPEGTARAIERNASPYTIKGEMRAVGSGRGAARRCSLA